MSRVRALAVPAPVAATSSPPGTGIVIEFRGSPNAQGDVPTAWSTNQDVADGNAYLQYRITLTADPVTGAVPWVDSLVVPYQ